MRRAALLLLVARLAAFQDGGALYRSKCAACHDSGGGEARIPPRSALAQMAPQAIVAALETGSMKVHAMALDPAGRSAVAEFLSGKPPAATPEAVELLVTAACTGAPPPVSLSAPHWNGWGVDLSNTRSQPAAAARLAPADVSRLKLKWAFGFPQDTVAAAQPTVAGGRVFVGSRAGRKVYALDARSGCTWWAFEAEAGVRTAISIGSLPGARFAAYFGDQRANAYAVDAATGVLLWKRKVEDHPAALITGSPVLHAGRLYVPVSSYEEATGAAPSYECCRFRGSVVALDASTGEQLWKSYTIPEPPRPTKKSKVGTQLWGPSGAAVWSAPTIDPMRRALYVATGDSYSDPPASTSDAFLAFDLDTGKLLWSRQVTANDAYTMGCNRPGKPNCPDADGPDFDFGSSPILVDLGGARRALLAGQKSGWVHAVDPDHQGEVLWQVQIGKGGKLGGIQWGSATDRDHVYVAVSDLTFSAAPRPDGGFALGLDPNAGGGLFALRLATGKTVWHAPAAGCGERKRCSPAQSAAVSMVPGVVFSGSVDGHLRAYQARDGKVIWDVDTAQEYSTVNGVAARGGSMDGPGPAIVDGMLYACSGYGQWGGMAGNVLLAFSVDGR